jgi:hypothetical protein
MHVRKKHAANKKRQETQGKEPRQKRQGKSSGTPLKSAHFTLKLLKKINGLLQIG